MFNSTGGRSSTPPVGVGSTLIRNARLVPVGGVAPSYPGLVSIRIVEGRVSDVAPELAHSADETVLDAAGRWAAPGLWDAHVHLAQWASLRSRLDVSGTASPAEVVQIVGEHLARLPRGTTDTLVVGSGFRSAPWSVQPTVADLDAVSGNHRIVLVSGDGHNGWLNSNALAFLGLSPRTTPLDENDWFPVYSELAAATGPGLEVSDAHRRVAQDAAARGVVGVADMEWAPNYLEWPRRFAAGVNQLRVRTATYPDRLEDVIAAGLRSGQPLPGGDGLVTMGPLKIISDGSLNTRTAWCWEPYRNATDMASPCGKQNYDLDELIALLARATSCGLTVALHAIGDAAVGAALNAFDETGATGSLEHAQLVQFSDLPLMAALGLRASVQPAHLLDDRDVVAQYWPDRADRCFPFQSMLRQGIRLALGSDAPVSPLDPWLAMAAAVHRSADDRAPWNEGEALTPAQALAASTDNQTTLAAGSRGDVVLLDSDPLASHETTTAAARHLLQTQVAATLVAGRVTHLSL